MRVVDDYALDSFLVQLPAKIMVVRDQLMVVGVRKMTHLDRTKIAKVFASPTANEHNRLESHKAMGIGNKLSSPMVPRVVPLATMAYISSVDSESSENEMHRAIHSNLTKEWKKDTHKG
ncbi:hypothetical protein J1N35_022239 [Gossypium stocksii]|uniref:Uncharacterized protein n=1 Tax=Gossypium stocksii TaxID=47602 RepID=A0A9D4A229_9ROSI|nr:hypothetical protein J1N35_022239 [Gossypium stocksii]